MDCTICVAKTKALISFTVTVKLICVFVSAYAKIRFSHNEAHFTSITQKAHGTYKHVLEGADFGVTGLTWWRKPENLGKTTDLEQATTTLPHAYLYHKRY